MSRTLEAVLVFVIAALMGVIVSQGMQWCGVSDRVAHHFAALVAVLAWLVFAPDRDE